MVAAGDDSRNIAQIKITGTGSETSEYCAAGSLSVTIGATSLKHVNRHRWQPCWEATASICQLLCAPLRKGKPARPVIKATCTHSLLTPIVSCLRG